MGLAEVPQSRSSHLTVKEAVEYWEVSERTLRRRLASGAPDCHRDAAGQWCLSFRWIESQFHRRRDVDGFPYNEDVPTKPTVPTPELRVEAPAKPSGEAWIQELLESERRATKAETELEVTRQLLVDLRAELQSAKSDLDYERSLVNRLKDQLRGDVT